MRVNPRQLVQLGIAVLIIALTPHTAAQGQSLNCFDLKATDCSLLIDGVLATQRESSAHFTFDFTAKTNVNNLSTYDIHVSADGAVENTTGTTPNTLLSVLNSLTAQANIDLSIKSK